MLPVLFSIGPITIYSFGFCLAVGFFLAAFIIWRRLREFGLEEEKIIDFILLAGLLGLLLSKLILTLENRGFSGSVFWAELLALELSLIWFARKEKWDFWQVADEVSFGILPFFVLVQIGVFLDGSAAGRPTSMPWGIYFPGTLLRSQPISLFLAVIFLFIWFLLLKIERQWRVWSWYKSKKSGLIHLVFLGLGGLTNFLVAFWRNSELYWHWGEIVISLAVAVTALGVLYSRSERVLSRDILFWWPSRRKNGQEGKKTKTKD